MASILASVLGGYALDKIGSAIGLGDGGVVPSDGIYKLHKGELVVPAKIVSRKAPAPKQKSIKEVVAKVAKVAKKAKKATSVAKKATKTKTKAKGKPKSKKARSPAQKANDKRLGEKARARRAGK